jgi:hypothetical protein
MGVETEKHSEVSVFIINGRGKQVTPFQNRYRGIESI